MTLQEILKAQGLEDEQIKTITAEMKANKIFTAGEENLDIRYGKLKTDFDNLTTQHTEATTLIDQLKASAKGNEAMQGKINDYEAQVAQLQAQLAETKLESAIKVALLDAKVKDIDYMTFKLKEKGELEIGEDGNIKGIDDKIAGLKTQHPNMFESASQGRKIDENTLDDGDDDRATEPQNLAEALKMQYESNEN